MQNILNIGVLVVIERIQSGKNYDAACNPCEPTLPEGAHQHPPFTPLGLGYLFAVLEKNQYEVDVIDCQALKLSYDGFKNEISKRKLAIVGMTSTTSPTNLCST